MIALILFLQFSLNKVHPDVHVKLTQVERSLVQGTPKVIDREKIIQSLIKLHQPDNACYVGYAANAAEITYSWSRKCAD